MDKKRNDSSDKENCNATKNKNRVIIISVLILYLLLIFIYTIVAKEYSYFVTQFMNQFSILRLLISTAILGILLALIPRIKDDITLFIYVCVLVLLFLGEAVCYIFNNSNPVALIGVTAFLVFIVMLQKTKLEIRESKLAKNPMPVLLIIAILLFIPFVILYHDKINLNNLFLSDVYETRAVFRENQYRIIGYITAPLSRVILPALIALSIKHKKYNYLVVCSIMVLFVFLCGALKSILFGLFAVLLFYKGDYNDKCVRLLIGLIISSILGIGLYYVFKNIEIINIFRRVFFVPPRLNSFYADYFLGNPDYLAHSPLGLGLTENEFGSSLSMYFGENIMNAPGFNANVGLIIEGFISFNYIGMILFAFLAAIIMHYFRWIKTNRIFAGILFVYIYYINTAFLSTLLLTHGLLFLILFAYLFMRERRIKV